MVDKLHGRQSFAVGHAGREASRGHSRSRYDQAPVKVLRQSGFRSKSWLAVQSRTSRKSQSARTKPNSRHRPSCRMARLISAPATAVPKFPATSDGLWRRISVSPGRTRTLLCRFRSTTKFPVRRTTSSSDGENGPFRDELPPATAMACLTFSAATGGQTMFLHRTAARPNRSIPPVLISRRPGLPQPAVHAMCHVGFEQRRCGCGWSNEPDCASALSRFALSAGRFTTLRPFSSGAGFV